MAMTAVRDVMLLRLKRRMKNDLVDWNYCVGGAVRVCHCIC